MHARPDRPAPLVEIARQQAGLTPRDLWLRYLALGGLASGRQLSDYLAGSAPLEAREYDVLAHALNERFTELDMDSPVPYSDELEAGRGTV